MQLGLHGGGAGGAGGFVVSFLTEDLRELRSFLTEKGIQVGEFHDTPRGAIMDVFDPDGNRLQAMQLGAKAAELAG
jgi:hypothetical protein